MLAFAKIYAQDLEITARPSQELIICCARTALDASTVERIKTLIEQDIDWDYVIQTSVDHKVLPLVYHNLSQTCSKGIPLQVKERLKALFAANARHNLYLTSELIKLLNLLASQDILAIPIKGAILATSAYGNLTMRSFSDIDILVREFDAIAVRDILKQQGYESTYSFTREQEIARLKSPYCKDNNYLHQDTQVNIDCHWRLLQRYLSFPLEHEKLWSRHGYASVLGKTVLTLSAEDNLIFLCVHGSRDRWKQLGLIVDVAEHIRANPKIDWQWLGEQARELGCRRRLLLGLFLAHHVVGTELPEEILEKIQDCRCVGSLGIQIGNKLFTDCSWDSLLLERTLFDLKLRDSLRDRATYCLYQSILVFARSKGLFPAWI